MSLFLGTKKLTANLSATVHAAPSQQPWLTRYTVKLGQFVQRYDCSSPEEAMEYASYDYLEFTRSLLV
jgi:hypothetical protein